jgi:hypothetical protein
MHKYQLKNIPAPLYTQIAESSEASFRSINQEILWRLQLSYEFEDAANTRREQALVDEALASGRPRRATKSDWHRLRKELFPK